MPKTKQLFIIIGIMVVLPLSHFAQNTIQGIVYDSITKKPLPFVNIIIQNTNTGTTTDINGHFSLKLSNINKQSLLLSYVGYYPKKYLINRDNKIQQIYLSPSVIGLGEVVISAKYNPAHRIVNQVIKHKDKNNPENLPQFAYKTYSKMIFSGEIINTDSLTMQKAQEYLSDYHLFIMESVTKRIFMQPDKSKETVLASRVSGFQDPSFTLLATQMQSFTFYNEYIQLSDKQYLSPITKNSIKHYDFKLKDTTYFQGDTVFLIAYKPKKNTNFEGLQGVLYINTLGYAIQNVIATPANAEKSNMEISIVQKYQLIQDTVWFPHQLNIEIIVKNFAVNGLTMIGNGKTYIKDIDLKPEINKRNFNEFDIEVNYDANNADSKFWDENRIDTLTKKDINTYKLIDSIGKEANLDQKMKGLESFLEGRLPIGFWDLNLHDLINYNQYEKFRLGFGGQTNHKLWYRVRLGGFLAYGFGDMAYKYGSHILIKINKNADALVKIGYENDVEEPGKMTFYPDYKHTFDEAYRDFLISKMFKVERYYSQFQFRFLRHFKFGTAIRYEKTAPCFDYLYNTHNTDLLQIWQPNSDYAEVSFGLRIGIKEKFIQSPHSLISLGTKYPLIYLQATKHIPYQNANNTGWQFQLYITKKLKTKLAGTSEFSVFAGYNTHDLPYYKLYGHRGNFKDFYLVSKNTFETMGVHSFVSDRFVAIHHVHDFGKLLLRFKKFTPEFAIATNFLYGKLSSNKHKNITYQVPDKGFIESGLIINNLLKNNLYGIGIGSFYKYGAYSNSNWQKNFSYKLCIKFSL